MQKKTGFPLKIIHPGEKEEHWLEKGVLFNDGCYDAVLSYRHLQKARWIKENGYHVEFGGLGGEFTKGVYYTPVRWRFPRHGDETFYYEKMLASTGRLGKWCGVAIWESIDGYKPIVMELARKGTTEATMQAGCNAVVYDKLGYIMASQTNPNSDIFAKIDPMMDRRIVAAVSQKNHYSLAMNIWERRQIAKYCPILSDIETDTGLSCSVALIPLTKERLKKLAFYISRVISRIRKKLGLNYTTATSPLWDRDYAAARKTTTWKDAFVRCKELGFINEIADENDIPLNQTGHILLLGLVFSDNFESIFEEHHQTLYDTEG